MCGENFLINLDERETLMGFYQTIYLEADDPEQAELSAVNVIRESDLKEVVIQNPELSPMIYLEEIEEIANFDEADSLVEGRSFYPMDDNDPINKEFDV